MMNENHLIKNRWWNRRTAVLYALAATAVSTTGAWGQGFVPGDLYLMTSDYPGEGYALMRIDPDTGAQTVLVTNADWKNQGIVDPAGTLRTSLTHDSGTDRLVITASLPSRTLFFVDSNGELSETLYYGGISGVSAVTGNAMVTDGEGRIYLYDGRYFGYINADHATGGYVMDTDGSTPLYLVTSSSSPTLLYEPTTHSLFVTHGGAESLVYRIPLSADGTQVDGSIDMASYESGYAGEVPVSLSRGPSHDANGNAFPNGTIFIKIDINQNAVDGQLMFLIDPVTLEFFPYATSGDYLDGGSTVATYNSVYGWAAELDTGGTNAVRVWDYDPGNPQVPTVLSSNVSGLYGSAESATIISIGDTVGGIAPPPNDPPTITGDPGPFVLNEGEVFNLTLTVDDAEGDAVIIDDTNLLDGMTAAPLDGLPPFDITVTWTPTAADDAGAPYQVCLSAQDVYGDSSEFCFTIADINQKPVADAGTDLSANENEGVSLDGTASGDPDLDAIQFVWTQISGPSVSLNSADSASPSFVAPSVGPEGAILTFELVTFDGALLSDPDFVNVNVSNVNHAPVADAGPDQVVNELTTVTLNAGDSFDPDGEALAVEWIQTAGETVSILNADQAVAQFEAPEVSGEPITLEFAVIADDGIDIDIDSVLVLVENVNHAPIADAGNTQAVDEGAFVVLDGSGSSDPDGDPLTFLWTQTAGPGVALDLTDPAHPAFYAPEVETGTQTLIFELIVSDGYLSSDPSTVAVSVRDAAAPPTTDLAEARIVQPDGTLSRDNVLWPPNHKLHEISIIGVADPNDLDVNITIDRVTQDEPLNGRDDGNTDEDAIVNIDGVLLLRAERSGSGDGRVYVIEFTATNADGVASPGVVEIVVPKSRRSGAIDSGQSVVSWLTL